MIVYIRVSDTTGREETIISPEVQLNECTRLIQREGLAAIGEPIVELDKTGRESTHRKISSIIDRIEAGEADGVVVWKISRWGRNTMDSLLNIGELQEAGGYILSATENLSDIDTPAGKFSLTVLLAIAQMFSDEIGKTWANIHDYRRAKGKTSHGTPRLGYLREGDAYRPDPQTGPWLRKAFEWYVQGVSMNQICQRLNAAGVRSMRGNRLAQRSLMASMDGGFAAGLIVDRRGGTVEYAKGAHEPLIDEDLWDRYLLRRHNHAAPRTKSAPYRLSGLLRCAGCGALLSAYWRVNAKSERYRYFRCHRLQRSLHTKDCPSPAYVSEHRAEEVVLEWLKEHADGPKALEAHLAASRRAEQGTADLKKIDRDVQRLQKRLSLLTDRMLDGTISAEAYRVKEQEMLGEIETLRAYRLETKVSVTVNDMPPQTVFGAALTGWDLVDPAVMNEALRQVLDHVKVRKGSEKRSAPTLEVVPVWSKHLGTAS